MDGRDWTVSEADACDEPRLSRLVDVVRGHSSSSGISGGANHHFYQFPPHCILSARMEYSKREGQETGIHSSLFHEFFRTDLTFDFLYFYIVHFFIA
jgi:hypothetical protein